MKNNKGITLIALIITIIVLLILAGVSIAMLAGDNNIFGRATEASITTKLTNVQELLGVEVSDAVTQYYNKTYVDSEAEGQDSLYAAITTAVQKVDLPTGVTADFGGVEAEKKTDQKDFSGFDYAKLHGTGDTVKTVTITLKYAEDSSTTWRTTGTFKGLALTWTAPTTAEPADDSSEST